MCHEIYRFTCNCHCSPCNCKYGPSSKPPQNYVEQVVADAVANRIGEFTDLKIEVDASVKSVQEAVKQIEADIALVPSADTFSSSEGASKIGTELGFTVQDELTSHRGQLTTLGTSVQNLDDKANVTNLQIKGINSVLLGKLDSSIYQSGMALKAPLNSPVFTGTPTVPTAIQGDSSTKIANTAYVMAALAALVDSSPAALDTLNELAAALGDDPNFATTMSNALGLKAPLASPALTGTPTAPTASAEANNTQIATTAFVAAAIAALSALKASKGVNNDITNLTGLTTALSRSQGGTGQTDVSYVRAEDVTTISLASAGFTLLAPAEVTDTKNAYLNGVWTCPADGFYDITGTVRFSTPTTTTCTRMVKIDSSTSPTTTAVLGQTAGVSAGSGDTILQVKCTLNLTAGTKLSLYAYHTDSAALNAIHKSLQILRVA